MDKFHQELFDVLNRCRNNIINRESKSASTTNAMITKAAASIAVGDVNNRGAQVIADFINNRR
jgi:hypothetical protein